MHARVTTVEGSPEKAEDAIRVIKEHVIPAAQRLNGFKGGYWFVNRKSGKACSFTLFESESALRASDAEASKIRESATQQIGSRIVSVEDFELVAEAKVPATA